MRLSILLILLICFVQLASSEMHETKDSYLLRKLKKECHRYMDPGECPSEGNGILLNRKGDELKYEDPERFEGADAIGRDRKRNVVEEYGEGLVIGAIIGGCLICCGCLCLVKFCMNLCEPGRDLEIT